MADGGAAVLSPPPPRRRGRLTLSTRSRAQRAAPSKVATAAPTDGGGAFLVTTPGSSPLDSSLRQTLEPNCAAQSNFPTMYSSADAAANIYMDTKEISYERIALLRSVAQECIYEDQLWPLLKKKVAPICYVWFEPSPWMHIAQGIMKTIYVNKMLKVGCTVKILIADWFVQRNYKICNNKNNMRTIGCYNIEMWKAAGMDLDRVELVWLSDELDHHAADYWPLALDVSRKYTLKRIASYHAELAYGSNTLPAAEIFYPCMQVAATLCQKLQADIWLFSMDQRDIVMRTREYCEDMKRDTKPIIMLHNMLPNLVDSPYLLEDFYFHDLRDPAWNIFMHDREHVLNYKIRRAFCPPKVADRNPCLEYVKYIIFPWFGKFEVVQNEQNGSNKTYANIEDLLVDYESGHLDPVDVKLALGKGIYKILKHVWDSFNSNTGAQALLTALEEVQERTVSADLRKIQCQNDEIINPGRCY